MRWSSVLLCVIGFVLLIGIFPIVPVATIGPVEPSPHLPAFHQESCRAAPAICRCAYPLLPHVTNSALLRDTLLDGGIRVANGLETQAWAERRLAGLSEPHRGRVLGEVETLDMDVVFACFADLYRAYRETADEG